MLTEPPDIYIKKQFESMENKKNCFSQHSIKIVLRIKPFQSYFVVLISINLFTSVVELSPKFQINSPNCIKNKSIKRFVGLQTLFCTLHY